MRGIWVMAVVFLEGNIIPTSQWLVITATCKAKDPFYSGELCSPSVNPSWFLKALDHSFSPPKLCAAQHGPRFLPHIRSLLPFKIVQKVSSVSADSSFLRDLLISMVHVKQMGWDHWKPWSPGHDTLLRPQEKPKFFNVYWITITIGVGKQSCLGPMPKINGVAINFPSVPIEKDNSSTKGWVKGWGEISGTGNMSVLLSGTVQT